MRLAAAEHSASAVVPLRTADNCSGSDEARQPQPASINRELPSVGAELETGQTLETCNASEHAEQHPPVRLLLLVMLCMFQGYASMVGPPQQKFKKELGIGQTGSEAHLFTQAAVFVHWGKFVARLGHSVVFGFCSPTARTYISMVLMLVGCAVPPLFVFALGSKWLGTVFLSYGLSGIGLGVFECNFLAVVTPLGKLTKAWAIMGAPIGFGVINILGLVCISYQMPVEALYWYIVACVPVGMAVMYWLLPAPGVARTSGAAQGSVAQASLAESFRAWRSWLPPMIPHIVAKVVVNFVMENVTPVNFYTYNAAQVPLFSKSSTTSLMEKNRFFALLYVFVILGDTVSRRVPYFMVLDRYSQNVSLLTAASLCSVAGFYFESFAIASVTLPAVFLAFWGNGLVYGVSAKYIDRFVPQEHNLAAYSMWCFMGDLGSIAGGSLVDVVRNWICGGIEYPFECRKTN